MAESVIPGRALFGTTFSIVTFIADESVRILQLCLHIGQCILRPVSSYTKLSLDGKEANQSVLVVGFWKKMKKKKKEEKEEEVRTNGGSLEFKPAHVLDWLWFYVTYAS